jgi:hypothetical protein
MPTRLLIAYIALFLLGLIYDRIVEKEISNGRADFQARLVAAGVSGTVVVLGAATENWTWTAITLLAFAFSGTPMIWGSWKRRAAQ